MTKRTHLYRETDIQVRTAIKSIGSTAAGCTVRTLGELLPECLSPEDLGVDTSL